MRNCAIIHPLHLELETALLRLKEVMGGSSSLLDGGRMSSQVDEQQQIQFELEGLKRTLEWTEIQREQLLDRLDLLRLDNARLQDRVEELERQVEGLKQQQPLF
jgi:uncharacterized protein YhaN